MSIYEERLEHDLDEIRSCTQQLGNLVVQAVQDSTEAVHSGDRQLAYRTILRDQIANRLAQSIDQLCHAFVVRHSPSAGHLRFVSSVLRISIALERVGDYAVTISRETVRLDQLPRERVMRDLDVSVGLTVQALKQALTAFCDCNPELARGTKKMASEQGTTFNTAFADLVDEGEKGTVPIRDLFAQLLVFNRLSRVCDQAKNICEETVFVALGEAKQPKTFRILFADKCDGQASQMALAIALKNYQGKADFSGTGWETSAGNETEVEGFLVAQGHDLSRIAPVQVEEDERALSQFHVIIVLDEGGADSLGRVPYSTVVLDWSRELLLSAEEPSQRCQETYKILSAKLDDLMEILIGSSTD